MFIKRLHAHSLKYFNLNQDLSVKNNFLPSPGCTGPPGLDEDTPEANFGLEPELISFEDCF